MAVYPPFGYTPPIPPLTQSSGVVGHGGAGFLLIQFGSGNGHQPTGQETSSGSHQPNRGAPARVFALTHRDAASSNTVATGTLLVCSFDASVLFDPGATYSFVSSHFASRIAITPEYIDTH